MPLKPRAWQVVCNIRVSDALMLATATNALVRALLAPDCVACRTPLDRPLDSPVCSRCWRGVVEITPPWCGCCGDALASWRERRQLCPRCRRHPPRFSIARSAGRYEGALRQIVHAFKYDRRPLLAEPLAALMRRAGAELLGDADAVVPVPLHPWRALHRGFNQADELACRLGLPVWRVLRRRGRGRPQAGLPAARRHANVRHAFVRKMGRWGGLLVTPCARRLPGRTVVLVDDVMTTGATLDACSAVLLEAGVRNVRALTVARASAGWPALPLLPHDLSSAQRR